MKNVIIILAVMVGFAQSRLDAAAPTNQAELDVRLAELREQYAPFLRSLPVPLPKHERTALPVEWKFTFEAKESPKVEGIPPAPAWYGVDFDDSKWETTTVPEWRYRTREGDDTALEPDKLDKKKIGGRTADTICWYRTTLRAEQTPAGKRTWLCFDGVEWEAQVYLNGELLGTHRVYYEPFRFDVTGKLKRENTLAVRVISGRSYGQPISYWGVFPDIRAVKQRYTPDRAQSIPGNLPIGYHSGCGFGIFRNVYLEQTGSERIDAIFVRNDLSDGKARVKVELDGQPAEVQVEVMPENFEGQSYVKASKEPTLEILMPGAKVWTPETPYLYRCRVTVAGSDAREVLFGCRSFGLVHRKEEPPAEPATRPISTVEPVNDGLPSGTLLLNGKPCYLRGANIQGLNCYSYWGESEKLLNALLLLKAANFNCVRSCQHVEFPEVLEMMDRFGILSEQDQGGGHRNSIDMGIRREQHIHTGTVLARQTYNHPGVVLLCFGNEHEFPAEPIVRAALAVDPQRIFKPISGRFSHSRKPWDLPDDLRANAIDDGHAYSGWYGGAPRTWGNLQILSPRRLVTLGEYGAEALDSYETMHDHYPPQFKPPAPDTDTLWASSQVQKHDLKQIGGFGRDPKNLGEYIEASQNYQEALLADKTIGMRLSPHAVAGYFQFHFLDVIPAFWPKAIVSHDFRPKKAFYQMAQINQPLVPLPQLTGKRPDAMKLWVANDLAESFPQAVLRWTVRHDGRTLLTGQQTIDVPSLDAASGPTVSLLPVASKVAALELGLTLTDTTGKLLSRYQRTVRVFPEEALVKPDATTDPFNKTHE